MLRLYSVSSLRQRRIRQCILTLIGIKAERKLSPPNEAKTTKQELRQNKASQKNNTLTITG